MQPRRATPNARSRCATLFMPVLAACLVMVLSACGSGPSRVAGKTPAASGPVAESRPAAGTGAYYKDDGPHSAVPENLDAVPDAVPRFEPFHPPTLRPYTVMGQRFVPIAESRPFRERGHASWYGRRFHGNPTSTGEPYDMYAMTAAHPTLPLPSYVRVTHLGNGRSVVVRVNDRGPFLRGRVIDLSYAAAHRLGYINAGSAEVEVELITHEDIRLAASNARPAQMAIVSQPGPATLPPTPAVEPHASLPLPLAGVNPAEAGVGTFLQLGAFATPANAEGLVLRIRTELSVLADRLHLFDDGGRYRLQIGPFASMDEARSEAARIAMLFDLQPFIVVR